MWRKSNSWEKNVASLRIQPQEGGRRKQTDLSTGGFQLLAGWEWLAYTSTE